MSKNNKNKNTDKLETIPNNVMLFVSICYWDCPACFQRNQTNLRSNENKPSMVHCNQCGRNFSADYEYE